jgi:hypothetical protein
LSESKKSERGGKRVTDGKSANKIISAFEKKQ